MAPTGAIHGNVEPAEALRGELRERADFAAACDVAGE